MEQYGFTIQNKIATILKKHSCTNQLKREELLERLRSLSEMVTDREMRRVVSEMVSHGHYPIGTSNEGYFWISTISDLETAEKELAQKIEAMSVRRHCLKRNFEEAQQSQTYIPGVLPL